MSSAVIIQQASGLTRLMLELTAGRHADYCAKHQITYWPVFGDVQFLLPATWNKIVLVREALALGFETIVWLDADTLIMRDDEDIRVAINRGSPLALARHPAANLDGTPGHWNCGVMFIHNTPRTREFFEAVWNSGPLGDHHWLDQARILNLLPQYPDILQRLDDRWNSTVGVTDVPNPVIKAWHGFGPSALVHIYNELARTGGLDARARAVSEKFVHGDNAIQNSERAIARILPCPDTFRGRGIVMCAGGRGYFPCAWVCIHQLRRLGCHLPIQMWNLGARELDARMRSLVEPLGVECIDGTMVRQQHPARILNGFELKPFSILHSSFREVLFLDADNVPVVNPEFLFDTPQYRETGAIFWPDYWRMKPDRAAWKFFGVPYRDEPEFESGQMVIDKVRCWRPLNLAMWFNEHSDFFYHHAHGDKDTYRFAWHRCDQPFSVPPFPIQSLEGTMCQHDFEGRRIFQHRNTDKWNFFRDNKYIEGFLFEEECRGDIRRLREVWDGVIRNS